MSKHSVGSLKSLVLVLCLVATAALSGCYYHDYYGHDDYYDGHYGHHHRH